MPCNPNAKYRTITGECNNLQHPLYGMTSTANQRIMPPKYDDGKYQIHLNSNDELITLISLVPVV